MKRTRHAALPCLASALLAGSALGAATQYDVYLLSGQSNMDGRGQAADLSETERKPFEHAVIFYRNPPVTSDGWKPLAPGFSACAASAATGTTT